METKIIINQPIEAEGTVLRVGFYVLMLVDLPADRSTVCTLKAVEHNIIATVFANPNLPNCATGQKRVQVLRTEAGQQPALHAWFHSGDSIGLEFREVHGTSTVGAAHRPGTTVSNSSSN